MNSVRTPSTYQRLRGSIRGLSRLVRVPMLMTPAVRIVRGRVDAHDLLIRRLRFVPAMLFVAFFLPNTYLSPFNSLFLIGRWGILLGALAWTLQLIGRSRLHAQTELSMALVMAFGGVACTLPMSNNPLVSAAKWGVFALFLVLCFLLASQLRDSRDVVVLLQPLLWIFLGIIVLTPLSTFVYPQRLFHFGYINGFLRNPNGLGLFLVIFGLPTALFLLETSGRHQRSQLLGLGFTVTATVLLVLSGSRAAAIPAVVYLAIAFWRWRGLRGAMAPVIKVGTLALVLFAFMGQSDSVRAFLLKYPDAQSFLQSRHSHWAATLDAFERNPWFGTGFGVQTQQAQMRLSYRSSGEFREQGSAYLGLLEEVGLIGTVPMLLALGIIAVQAGSVLLVSTNPLRVFFARILMTGLLWGISENYLLYLGNGASILFFLAFFLNERLNVILRSNQRVLAHRAGFTEVRGRRGTLGWTGSA